MRGRFTIPCLVIGLLALFGYGLALSIPEGWELLARSRSGDPAAREALERAYRAGDPQAIAALGALHPDPARSRLLFRESFGRGSPWAGFWLATLYAYGIGVALDRQAALGYARKSAEGGYAGGELLALFLRYRLGRISYREYAQGVERLAPLHPQDPVALDFLAQVRSYAALRDPEKDQSGLLQEARELLRRAMGRGYFPAEARYASFLYFGVGGPPDQLEALRIARPLSGLSPLAAGLVAFDLYFGGVERKDPAGACRRVRGVTPTDLSGLARVVYGLCRMDAGRKVEGYAHLLRAAADSRAARALAQERGRELTPGEREAA